MNKPAVSNFQENQNNWAVLDRQGSFGILNANESPDKGATCTPRF